MLRFTLAQMRVSLPRLVAGGLAILIGTAFVAATLLSSSVMTETARNAVTGAYADADLVITDQLDDRELAAAAAAEGVASFSGRQTVWGEVRGADGSASTAVSSLAADRALEPQKLTEGSWPASGQVALPADVADRLGVRPGDAVDVRFTWWQADSTDPDDEGRTRTQTVRQVVSGLLEDPAGAFSQTGGETLAPADAVRQWFAMTQDESSPEYGLTLLRVRPGVDPALVSAAVNKALLDTTEHRDYPPIARTVADQADRAVAELTGGTQVLLVFVLGFAAIALVVAALVISNTFQVLVAQRTRTLALLRCVGAVKQQVRRSVLLEAVIVGLAASLAGLLAGAALAQVTLLVLRSVDVGVPLPAAVNLTWPVVVVPLLVGTVVTAAAAMVPARAATRVAPLAAMRPDAGPTVRKRGGVLRLVLAVVLTAAGATLLVGGLALSANGSREAGLGIGVLGGAVSFVGVLVGAVFWVPRVTGWIGSGVRRVGGPGAELAAVNSVRNPRRTAATTSALLIGVTLVTLMSTGAASARSTLTKELDERFPVDVSLGDGPAWNDEGAVVSQPVADEQLRAAATVEGVESVVPVSAGTAVASWKAGEGHSASGPTGDQYVITGLSPAAVEILRSEDARRAVTDGKIVLSTDGESFLSRSPGPLPESVRIEGRGPGAEPRTVEVLWQKLPFAQGLASEETLRTLGIATKPTQAWVRLAGTDHPRAVIDRMADALTRAATGDVPPAQITGVAVERADYDRVIDTLLAIVIGLLGVAVVIAIVGVANTLSLSVIERRRESATLRAIGLTRRQLRWSLACEGMVIAAVGALAGILLGMLYGWVGARTVLGGLTEVQLSVSVRDLVLTAAVAVLAGLLASVLPSRGAAKASPMAALAAD